MLKSFHTRIHKCIHTFIKTYIPTYTYIYTQVYTYIHIYIHTHKDMYIHNTFTNIHNLKIYPITGHKVQDFE
jgi:hypothetical protein